MLRQNDALPQFTGMEPVSLLIEMGIEKLKRDYLYIFSGKFNSPEFVKNVKTFMIWIFVFEL